MTEEAMLCTEKGQVFGKYDEEIVSEVNTGIAVFLSEEVDLTLGEGLGISAGAGRENLADVVRRLAPRIPTLNRRLVPQLVRAELRLQTVIVGVARVRAFANNTLVAVCASNRCWHCCARRGARRHAGRNQVRIEGS